MIPTMRLISEGRSDAVILQKILDQKHIQVQIKSVTPSGGGGIAQLAQDLEVLIDAIMKQKKHGDCVVVLHDADVTRPMSDSHRKHYAYIDNICLSQKYRDTVTLIIANDELEAWLLADTKLCKWLGVKPKTNCDSLEKPKDDLDRLIRKRSDNKMRWSERFWADILGNIDGTGDKLSASMRNALNLIKDLPCAKSE